jgi:hypothetical protein
LLLAIRKKDVRISVERHGLACVSELRGQVGDGDTLTDLERGVAVAQIVRVEMRDTRRLARRAMTFLATSGEKPWNTRRSAVRSSGGQVSAICSMSLWGTATHRRAVAVFP